MTAIIYMKLSVDIHFCCASVWTIRGSNSGKGQPISYFYKAPKPVVPSTHLPIQWVPGVKRPGRYADHLPASNTKNQNE
jgi:hypothetical protein